MSPLYAVTVLLSTFLGTASTVHVPTVRMHDGYDMPALALGTWLGNNTKPGKDEVERAVSWALEAGYSHIDTAYAYGVENQIGKALANKFREGLKREDVFVTTKLWNTAHARSSAVPALRRSLHSLGLDYVDLYLIHWPIGSTHLNGSYNVIDYAETWRGMQDARKLGLTRSIGLSNFNEQQIDRLLELGLEKPAVLQVEVNLNLQQMALRQYCARQQIVMQAYSPFGSLFPQRAAPSAPPPRVDDPELIAIAKSHNKTVPQVVLRYLVELGVVPLPKSLTKSRIEQNVDVFDFTLSKEEIATLAKYERGYRTIPQYKWLDHPYYPFEKPATASADHTTQH